MKMNKKGFTLVEIMIVVAIIGILAAIAIPNFVRYRKTAQANACVGNLKQLQSATEQYLMSHAGKDTVEMNDIVGSDLYLKATPLCPKTKSNSYTLGGQTKNIPTCENNTESDYPHQLPDDVK